MFRVLVRLVQPFVVLEGWDNLFKSTAIIQHKDHQHQIGKAINATDNLLILLQLITQLHAPFNSLVHSSRYDRHWIDHFDCWYAWLVQLGLVQLWRKHNDHNEIGHIHTRIENDKDRLQSRGLGGGKVILVDVFLRLGLRRSLVVLIIGRGEAAILEQGLALLLLPFIIGGYSKGRGLAEFPGRLVYRVLTQVQAFQFLMLFHIDRLRANIVDKQCDRTHQKKCRQVRKNKRNSSWPYIVQLSWLIRDHQERLVSQKDEPC